MACMRLGSKSDTLRYQDQTWLCSSGLASDVTVEVGDTTFHLHKFPLISRSGRLERLIGELKLEDGSNCLVKLNDLPGGSKAFELVTKFCYGMKLEITSLNIVTLRCAGEYLEMTEEYGEENLIVVTETFLSEIFDSWTDSIKALETCEDVLAQAEKVNIVSRCINSLAMKAFSDQSLLNRPISGQIKNSKNKALCFLFYKRFIKVIEAKGMKPERVSGSVMHYANKNIPLFHNQTNLVDENHTSSDELSQTSLDSDQRHLLEEIANLFPTQKGVTPTNFLLNLLKKAISLHANQSCIDTLERRVGSQLDQATLVDLLIPNTNYSSETLYDLDCFQRIVDHFMQIQLNMPGTSSPMALSNDDQLVTASQTISSMTLVAELVDLYLAEVAPDVNVKPSKFQSIAAIIPDYARTIYDGFYHAIDIYLKAHPWLTEVEREQICRLMNCQKLSLEASTHAAQNERLPLRVIVQVLFFEQLRLRTQISGWFFASNNLDSSTNRNQDNIKDDRQSMVSSNIVERVFEIEKKCLIMRQEIHKLAKSKKRWAIFSKMFARPKQRSNKLGEVKFGQPKAQQHDDIVTFQDKIQGKVKAMIVDKDGTIIN
ncbi:hypothetical protein RND81_06G081300 [Saponaria officinalis]|uniref:Phototropic-responsive NPH3 family protein n=1 Tax=Saponaria officinalis TaxID=3572 RepID=A0AAW1K956_SAPOF